MQGTTICILGNYAIITDFMASNKPEHFHHKQPSGPPPLPWRVAALGTGGIQAGLQRAPARWGCVVYKVWHFALPSTSSEIRRKQAELLRYFVWG